MKKFYVNQQYASVQYAKQGLKLSQPLSCGYYQARTATSAVNKAAKEWKVPAALLQATIANERVTSEV